MRERREILTHILMVVAPLVMLAALTMAWFVRSNTAPVAPMSFASTDTGPGAALHRTTEIRDRTFTPPADAAPAVLTNTVTWGPEELPEDSDITIRNMLPGQCAYYLLVSNGPVSVSFVNVEFRNEKGERMETGETLPLAQCLGFYLIPFDTTSIKDPWENITVEAFPLHFPVTPAASSPTPPSRGRCPPGPCPGWGGRGHPLQRLCPGRLLRPRVSPERPGTAPGGPTGGERHLLPHLYSGGAVSYGKKLLSILVDLFCVAAILFSLLAGWTVLTTPGARRPASWATPCSPCSPAAWSPPCRN